MTIKIGAKTHRTQKPKDLDAALLKASGISAQETVRLLSGNPLAHHVARAALPFLAEPVEVSELASAIADAGVAEVAAEVLALYATDKPATPDAAA